MSHPGFSSIESMLVKGNLGGKQEITRLFTK